MARSPKEDPMYGEMQHNTWKYCESGEGPADRKPSSLSSSPVMNDSSVYANYSGEVFMNKPPYGVQATEIAAGEASLPAATRASRQHYGNVMLDLSNGQLVRVYFDENNRQHIVPVTGQYELFSHNAGLPLQTPQPPPPPQAPHMFNLNQEYSNTHVQPTVQNTFTQDNNQSVPTSNFLKEMLCNWEPNSTGTYSPFGQNYPLNHPDAPTLNSHLSSAVMDPIAQVVKPPEASPKKNVHSPLADTSTKKRIVAEVKPMRPTFADVLAKNTKNNQQAEASRKVKPQNVETKPNNNKTNSKPEKATASTKHDDSKHKEKKIPNTISSGSESGDVNTDDVEKCQKPNKKLKNKRSNISRSSLDDFSNEEVSGFKENECQFVFIANQAEKPKKEKKDYKVKHGDNSPSTADDFKLEEEDDSSQFVLPDGQGEAKARKKKESRNQYKTAKPAQEKKKPVQVKTRRNKPGYFGLAQNYLEHWGEATWKAAFWFIYLLSDICGMSAHLTFDLCTSVFTQTYVSSQAVWRSSKDYISKIGNNKYLLYIDRKLGHTKFGFWRKLKWFKKDVSEAESDSSNDPSKLNSNIPLPATGEEAMKRLLACKGKDPYSILGVSTTCTDEEIKRYYRRQAFLVHPDKNQQPGAEEAFKILQHAFDLIGEPERREAYSRRALESRHTEAALGELSRLLAQLHDKMEFAANTIRCTNCGRRHKRVLTERPCYAARYCAQCKIRHSAKEGDIWAESSMLGLLVMFYACMDGAVYQITQWASCQKKNLKQLRPDCHVVQYRIVLGNKAAAADTPLTRPAPGHDPNLEEFLNTLYSKSAASPPPADDKKRRNKKTKS